jgi:hypothetical protein
MLAAVGRFLTAQPRVRFAVFGVDEDDAGLFERALYCFNGVWPDQIISSIEHIRSDKARALAVTAATLSQALPDIPTVANFVRGASMWFGVNVPKNTPAEIIDRLNKEINVGLADPNVQAQLANMGGAVRAGSAADFGHLIVDETEKWRKVVKFAGRQWRDPQATLGSTRRHWSPAVAPPA